MQSRMREVEGLLNLASNDEIRVVGICGTGGVGKSTLVRVLHDRISQHFDASYLVLNAIKFYGTTGLRHPKQTLILLDCVDIKDICPLLVIAVRDKWLGGGNRIIITSRDEGVIKVFEKHDFYRVKLFVIAVRDKWLGGGNRIIITSRDEGVIKVFEKHDFYRVKLLIKDEALLLFCRKAFKYDLPMMGYEEQIDSALKYASSLPLAMATPKVEAIVLELEDSQGSTLRAKGLSRMDNLEEFGERENIRQSFSRKRQKLCRQKAI
ncbi:disease resistance-like protein DSC2 [Neltuma alba]|uniref:disease resistance-like protein DSC2 n=1 Tax=Neltuma alba TaxID=207710 RepID=UPI0010A37B03|nr:disease resistance-like protein DSC2 [Prosopis alba]